MMGAPDTRGRILALCGVDIMAWVLLRHLWTALIEAGYEVHVGCAVAQHRAKLESIGVTVHDVPFRRSFNPLGHIAPVFAVKRLIRTVRPDVINIHGILAGLAGRIGTLGARAPVLFCVHGFYFHDRMPKYQAAPIVAIERFLGRHVSRFMFVSPEDADTAARSGIVRRGVPADKWTNGVDPHVFRPADDGDERTRIRNSLGFSDGDVVVGIVGRIVKEKGFRELIAAAETLCPRFPQLRLLVVGATLPTDRDQFGERFLEMVSASGLTDRFVLTGQVENVPEVLRAMDVFVLPSYREGFPKSILEAMASGLPVVTTRIRGCREAVVDGVTGLLAPAQAVEPLTAAIELLLRDEGARRRMGAAGRRRVLDHYTQARVVSTYLRAVSSLC